MNRRSFLRGLMATTAAGFLIPERKVWALDQTMVRGEARSDLFIRDMSGWSDLVRPHPFWYQVRAMGQDFDGRGWYELKDGVDVNRM